MDLGSIQKSKKLDVSEFFGEGEFLTIKYIPRDMWQKINRLALKRSDTLLYSEYKKMFGDDNKKDEKKQVERITEIMRGISTEELEEAQAVEEKTNRMIIENGLSENDHSFTNDGKTVKLTADVIQQIGHVASNKISFYEFLISEIRAYNSGFDLGEKIDKK